ncbi:MAG: MFS transporter [Deltaproteobacteria bacterium]|jgi:MFS family permease|nr:MFS transporter [Deltaproteobacteria bacterium]
MLYTPSFWAMAVANLAHTASFSAMFLLPLFVLDQGGDQKDIGLVMGLFALSSAACRPWISEMIDRLGRKRSYSIGCLIMVVMPLLYLSLDNPLTMTYQVFLSGRVVHGVGMAICFTGVFTYMADIVPKERFNEGIGMFGISGLIGIAVGPLIAETVLRQFGYSGFFVTISGLALTALLVHQPLSESFPRHKRQRGPSFFSLLGLHKFQLVALLCLLFGLGLAGTGNFVAPLAEQRHLGLISFYYLSYASGAVLTRVFVSRLADRFGERKILPYGLCLYAGGLFLLPLTYHQPVLGLAGLLAGAGHGVLFPTLNSIAVRAEPQENRGKATGIFTGCIDTGAFAGSIVLGYIGNWFDLDIVFVTAGLGLTAGLMLFRSPPLKVNP